MTHFENAEHGLLLGRAQVLNPAGDGFLDDMDVLITNGQIARVDRGIHLSADYKNVLIDLNGRYVLPGLIDSHFHLISRSSNTIDDEIVAAGTIEGVLNARNQIEAGVTAVRDAGCRHHGIHALKRAIDGNLILGPRAFVAGLNPTGRGAPAGWRNIVIKGPKAMRQAVLEEARAGADWIKLVLSHAHDPVDWANVSQYLTGEEIAAAVSAAHGLGLKVGCHCEGWEIARLAVACGVDCLDHAALIDERVAADMAEKGVNYVPTLWAFTDDTGLDLAKMPKAQIEAVRRWQDEHRRSVTRAAAEGVTIGAGSDAMGAVPASDVLLREIRALAGAGLSNAAALRAATINGAKIIGQESRLGTIAVGRPADIAVVDADPLETLGALADPMLVIKDGRVVVDKLTGASRVSINVLPSVAVVTSRWD